jgi:hypothetical protein
MGPIRQPLAGVTMAPSSPSQRSKRSSDRREALAALEPQPGSCVSPGPPDPRTTD